MQSEKENPLFKKLIVSSNHREAKDFISLQFAGDDAQTIRYKAGQYLTLVHHFSNKEERRSYSITSSPYLDEPLSIGVKRIANGIFSRFLFDTIQPGDSLLTTGAAGLFTLPDELDNYDTVLLLAAGSGITPILSLLKTALHKHLFLKLVLIYSNHSPDEVAYNSVLRDLEKQYLDRLKIHFLFSTNKNIYRAHLHRDLLLEIIEEVVPAGKDKVLAFVCGPTNYRRMCLYTLQEAGLPDNNIRKETFDTSEPVVQNLPPDKEAHTVHIHVAGQSHTLLVHYPDTILKAAKKQHLSLPYSCEAGKCGNCAMRCTSGQVWMSYNEVLTQKDLQNGLVLTCTGHPVFGDVALHS